MNALKDPRTTASGFILSVVGLLAYFGIEIPEAVIQIAIVVGGALLMFFARDNNEEQT